MEPLEKSINQTDQAINMVKQTIEIANRLKAEKEALRAENTRLREALQFIAKDDDWQIYDAVDADFKLMREMVKATLKSTL
jgi:regulator of replication initiation timing